MERDGDVASGACGGFDFSTQCGISLTSTSDCVNTPNKSVQTVSGDDGIPLPPISSKYERTNVTYDRVPSTKDRGVDDDRDRIISSIYVQVPVGRGDEEEVVVGEERVDPPSSSLPPARDSSSSNSSLHNMADIPFKLDDPTLQRFKQERLSAVCSEVDFINDIFLFGRPQLLFEFLQIIVIALSLYVSLWITNYAFLPIPSWLKVIALVQSSALSFCCDRS